MYPVHSAESADHMLSHLFSLYSDHMTLPFITSCISDPSFVGSSLDQAEKKLYFFFSEIGKEFNFLDELQISRVSQVCKDDVGGQRTLQRKWTSFAKAKSPKQLPFNILQDVFTHGGCLLPAGALHLCPDDCCTLRVATKTSRPQITPSGLSRGGQQKQQLSRDLLSEQPRGPWTRPEGSRVKTCWSIHLSSSSQPVWPYTLCNVQSGL
ncbi:uncharacterized protein LOC114430271 isoform X1 [Parambassis ranga]|uniref:Uncharacterized protein LOC114430271 isoform X1 n=1 Tax=Parambassis ranga TaxID=210632 RepID=A0A6P7HFR8_9TELE|nr:uncharacterized protein LOC114430271 isoform X1 [Parambassis ranga]